MKKEEKKKKKNVGTTNVLAITKLQELYFAHFKIADSISFEKVLIFYVWRLLSKIILSLLDASDTNESR